MKFSFAMPNTVRVKALTQPFELDVTGADQTVMAKRAEELGYDMIPIPEHFIVPTEASARETVAEALGRLIDTFLALIAPQPG